jgi:hypothetical protein
MLPGLIKTLTGYESVFSRSGANFFENRLFFLMAVGATWLVIDPFVQTIYCLRCFQGESVETGEDLRAGLRRIRAAAAKGAVAALVLLSILAVSVLHTFAADAVGPGDLERSVKQAMQSHDYDWRIRPPAEAASDVPWIVRATDRAIKAVQSALNWLWDNFMKLLKWIFGGLGINMGPLPLGGAANASALHWSVWLLIVLAVALVGLVVWRAIQNRRKRPSKVSGRPVAAVRLDDEGLTADRLPEEGWLEMAAQAIADGNLRLALRAFYLANLAWLGRQEFLTIHPGKTNREFEIELRRKAQSVPDAREMFSANVRAFERAWYGLHDVSPDDLGDFRHRSDGIKKSLGAVAGRAAEAAA